MKFNLLAQKTNDITMKIDVELTPEEMIATLKQGNEDFKTIMTHKEEIKDLFKSMFDTYIETMKKVNAKQGGKDICQL